MAYYVFLYLFFLPTGLSQGFVPANFPQCANDCLAKFNDGTSIGSCAVGDASCVCAESTFQNGWACCVNTGCNEADKVSAIGTMKSQCPTSQNIGNCAAGKNPGGFGGSRGGGRFGGGGGRFNGGGGGSGGGQPAQPTPDPVTVTAPAPAPISVPVTIVSPVTIINPVTIASPVTINSPVTVNNPVEAPTPLPVPLSAITPVPSPATLTATSILTSLQEVIATSVVSNADAPSEAFPASQPIVTSILEQPSVSASESIDSSAKTPESTFETVTTSMTLVSSIDQPTAAPPSPILGPTDTSVPRSSKPMTDGQKAGVAIAVLVTVALIAFGTYFFMRWRKREIDKEFEELKEQHEANKSRPKSQAIPVYPRTDTTVIGGVRAYKDVFDKPGNDG